MICSIEDICMHIEGVQGYDFRPSEIDFHAICMQGNCHFFLTKLNGKKVKKESSREVTPLDGTLHACPHN